MTHFGPADMSLDLLAKSDPKNKLQTWSQRRGFGLPEYIEIENPVLSIILNLHFKLSLMGGFIV
jgi:hypothetical protein